MGWYLRNNGGAFFHIRSGTYDNNFAPGGGLGLLHIDSSAAVDNAGAYIGLWDFHPEVNTPLAETYAAGATLADRRGLIR